MSLCPGSISKRTVMVAKKQSFMEYSLFFALCFNRVAHISILVNGITITQLFRPKIWKCSCFLPFLHVPQGPLASPVQADCSSPRPLLVSILFKPRSLDLAMAFLIFWLWFLILFNLFSTQKL